MSFLNGETRRKTYIAAGVALVVAALLIAKVMMMPAVSLNEPDNKPAQLHKAADDVNRQVPQKIDAVTTLTGAEYVNQIFSYSYTMDPAVFTSQNWSADKMTSEIKKRACDVFHEYLGTPALDKLRYIYKTSGRTDMEIDVTAGDCAPAVPPSS